MMNRRTVSVTYAAVTSALLLANWFIFNDAARFETLAAWMAASALLGLSQIVFLVVAARMKSSAVVVMASGVLLALAAFVYLVSHMVS